jgi:hypothetical protein
VVKEKNSEVQIKEEVRGEQCYKRQEGRGIGSSEIGVAVEGAHLYVLPDTGSYTANHCILVWVAMLSTCIREWSAQSTVPLMSAPCMGCV